MLLRRPIRGLRLSLTPFGMCRSTRPASNSRSFCTCKTTSHLHIPHLLKVPQFQRFAQKPHLTPLVCADARTPGGRKPYSTRSEPGVRHRGSRFHKDVRAATGSESHFSAAAPFFSRRSKTQDLKGDYALDT